MRIVLFIVAILVTAFSIAPRIAASPGASPAHDAVIVAAISRAGPGLPADRLVRLGFGKVASAIVPVQAFACSPYEEGRRMCLNGWVWTCQCFSYGCQYMTGSRRC